MQISRRGARLLTALSIGVFAFSGCGGSGGDDDAGGDTPGDTPVSSPTPQTGSSPTPSSTSTPGGETATPGQASPTPDDSPGTPNGSSPTPESSSPTPTASDTPLPGTPLPGTPTPEPTSSEQTPSPTPPPEPVSPTPVPDIDQDGYTAAGGPGTADCDDTNPDIYPGADEVCNEVDDDCDDEADDGVTLTFFQDLDKDGYGGTVSIQACTAPAGYTAQTGDCQDTNNTVHPGAEEICDTLDNDCNGQIDDGTGAPYYQDLDHDGYGNPNVIVQACSMPSGYSAFPGDCRDTNDDVYPGAPESCNGIDDDCDGLTDENLTLTFYLDADGDGYGTSSVTTQACTVPSGYSAKPGDCNDSSSSTYPGAVEVCNGVDDNCQSQIDEGVPVTTWYRDADGDGYGDPSASTQGCAQPAGYTSNHSDCNDASAGIHPGATEVCNHVDDNCSGQADEGVTTLYYRDSDGDGYGSNTSSTADCSAPSGYISSSGDCNDSNASVHPNATETCNYTDDNCNGQTDEGVSTTYYRDYDGDGYGSSSYTTQACSQPSGYTTNSQDCNDSYSSIHPGAVENCSDSTDQDCSGIFNGIDPSCQLVGYSYSYAPDKPYYDEAHNINVNGAGQGSNNNGYDQYKPGQLSDGYKGTDNPTADLGNGAAYEWVGKANQDVSIYYQFGAVRTFTSVTIGMSCYTPYGIYEPSEIQIFFSNNGVSFDKVSVFSKSAGTLPTISSGKRGDVTLNVTGNTGKLLKVYLFHGGEWTFIDEISFK